ncbi:hypothetical protein HUW62_43245 [Myxococcus sp. AM011]|uniref:hypothetical protein n=1 Tax=Myxococcus sp. AM011 TaxID=2745200 RepID=UPI0015950E7C|nr:hypothetical protein [Myxococcus sp. AM011]NVJ28045.1 hypothetical protein [Myxococcus sp. AM011]
MLHYDMSQSLPSEEEFYSRIERGLSEFPQLAMRVPTGYPRDGNARLSPDASLHFEDYRTVRFGHNLTLPLALFLIGSEEARPEAQKVARHTIGRIEEFLSRVGTLSGVTQVIEPLWRSRFRENDAADPSFWSVIALADRTLRLCREGAEIHRFESPTGTGNKTADVHYSLNGEEVFLDVEVWNAARGETIQQAREFSIRRAEQKASNKFSSLPAHATGVVSEFCFPALDSFDLIASSQREFLEPFPIHSVPRCRGENFLFVGVADWNGQLHEVRVVDATTEPLPLLPEARRRR